MKCFYAVNLLTGYLVYLNRHFKNYLYQKVIDEFPIYNKEHLPPYIVASKSSFYLKHVLPNESTLQNKVTTLTIENMNNVLNQLSNNIKSIENRYYPLHRFSILKQFMKTQYHLYQNLDKKYLLDEIRCFLKRRLIQQKLPFSK